MPVIPKNAAAPRNAPPPEAPKPLPVTYGLRELDAAIGAAVSPGADPRLPSDLVEMTPAAEAEAEYELLFDVPVGVPLGEFFLVVDCSGTFKQYAEPARRYSEMFPRIVAAEFPEIAAQIVVSYGGVSGGLWLGDLGPISSAKFPEVIWGGTSPLIRSQCEAIEAMNRRAVALRKKGPLAARKLIFLTDTIESEVAAIDRLAARLAALRAASPELEVEVVVPDGDYDRRVAAILMGSADREPTLLADAISGGKASLAHLTEQLRQVARVVSNLTIRPGGYTPGD